MAPQKRVASLEDLSLPKVYSLIFNIMWNHDQNKFADEAQFLDDVMMVVSHVPPILHDKIAEIHIREIKDIFGEAENLNDDYEGNPFCICNYPYQTFKASEHFDAASRCKCPNFEACFDVLSKVLCLLRIKKIDLDEEIMTFYLKKKVIGLLDKMPYVESFKMYDPTRVNRYLLHSKLTEAGALWSNLTIFICQEMCTDEVLTTICKHCELLQEVDVRHSKVEKPIKPLVICKNLVKVNLENNNLFSKDYLELFSESQSDYLAQVDGMDEQLDDILRELENKKSLQTFKLRYLKVWERHFDEKYLNLVKKYFPSLTKIIFRRHHPNPEVIVDFSSLLNEVSCSYPAVKI